MRRGGTPVVRAKRVLTDAQRDEELVAQHVARMDVGQGGHKRMPELVVAGDGGLVQRP